MQAGIIVGNFAIGCLNEELIDVVEDRPENLSPETSASGGITSAANRIDA
jgi:hypothetical protein